MVTKFSVNHRGFRRAVLPSPYERMSSYLEDDIQSSYSANSVLNKVELVLQHKEEIEQVGNAYVVLIQSDKAILRCLYDGKPPFEVAIEDFKIIVEQWRDFLGQRITPVI